MTLISLNEQKGVAEVNDPFDISWIIPIKFLLDTICNFVPNTNYYVKGCTPGDQNGIYANNTLMKKILHEGQTTNLSEGLKKFIEATDI